jgi:hypothetical protein
MHEVDDDLQSMAGLIQHTIQERTRLQRRIHRAARRIAAAADARQQDMQQ